MHESGTLLAFATFILFLRVLPTISQLNSTDLATIVATVRIFPLTGTTTLPTPPSIPGPVTDLYSNYFGYLRIALRLRSARSPCSSAGTRPAAGASLPTTSPGIPAARICSTHASTEASVREPARSSSSCNCFGILYIVTPHSCTQGTSHGTSGRLGDQLHDHQPRGLSVGHRERRGRDCVLRRHRVQRQ